MGKKILYIMIIIVFVIAGICVAKQMSKENEVTQTGTNIINNGVVDTIKNNKENDEMIENNEIETESNEVNNKIEEETTSAFNPKEEAKRIVKENWGEDDSVYFYHEGIINDKHVVSVRESSTTKALYWYYVDVETGTFEIK